MKILGIDTILHDACAAVVENGNKVLANVRKHTLMASDNLINLTLLHSKQLPLIINSALKEAGVDFKKISLIAVNNFGSFFSNVMVGINAGNLLSQIYDIPIVGIHHQEAHFFSNWLERDFKEFSFPILVLSSSGGHSSLVLIEDKNFNFLEISRIEGMEEKSKTKPNFRGIGAVYAFLINNLKLGGRIESGLLVSKFARGGNPSRFDFSRPDSAKIFDLNFRWLERKIMKAIFGERRKNGGLSKRFISDICASFENSITSIIVNDLLKLVQKFRAKEIHLVGGISANDFLRNKLVKEAKTQKILARCPRKKEYCTDNAAMIASLGYYKFKQSPKNYLKQRNVEIESNLKLEKMAIEQKIKRGLC